MAVWQWHPSGVLDVLKGNTKFTGGSFKCLLLTSGYTIDPVEDQLTRNSFFAEVVGTGYTVGGATVTVGTSYNEYLNTVSLAFQDALWNPGTFTARTAVIYHNTGTLWTEYPLCWLTFDEDRSCYQSSFRVTGPILKIGLNP